MLDSVEWLDGLVSDRIHCISLQINVNGCLGKTRY